MLANQRFIFYFLFLAASSPRQVLGEAEKTMRAHPIVLKIVGVPMPILCFDFLLVPGRKTLGSQRLCQAVTQHSQLQVTESLRGQLTRRADLAAARNKKFRWALVSSGSVILTVWLHLYDHKMAAALATALRALRSKRGGKGKKMCELLCPLKSLPRKLIQQLPLTPHPTEQGHELISIFKEV